MMMKIGSAALAMLGMLTLGSKAQTTVRTVADTQPKELGRQQGLLSTAFYLRAQGIMEPA